jgi:alternate signal-mediated exported protein
MRTSTKGIIAATVGAILLLGGMGSLAYWTDSKSVQGGTINGGHMSLVVDSTNTGCGAWTLDAGEAAASTYTVGDPLVPGDVITRICHYTVHASGNHLRSTLAVSSPTFTGTGNDFDGKLTASVSSLKLDGVPATSFTEDDDGKSLSAAVAVTWNSNDTAHSDATTALDDLVLTASQVHN